MPQQSLQLKIGQFEIGSFVEQLFKLEQEDEADIYLNMGNDYARDGKGEDALKAQLVIEAAIKSWDTGKVITL